jgi:L-asparaginase II
MSRVSCECSKFTSVLRDSGAHLKTRSAVRSLQQLSNRGVVVTGIPNNTRTLASSEGNLHCSSTAKMEDHSRQAWELFRSWGSPQYFVAPMVDQVIRLKI